MSQTINDNNSNRKVDEKEIIDMIIDNNSEEMKNIKPNSLKMKNTKLSNIPQENQQTNENIADESFPTYKRRNSINLYKKNKLEKKKTNENCNLSKTNDKSSTNIQNEKDITNKINDNSQDIQEKNKKSQKKIKFKEPNFVEIIDVESYKQFNMENTSKDPYESLFNNDNNDNNNNNEKKDNGKERVICSCCIL